MDREAVPMQLLKRKAQNYLHLKINCYQRTGMFLTFQPSNGLQRQTLVKKHAVLLDLFGRGLRVKKWALLREIAAAPGTSLKLLPGSLKEIFLQKLKRGRDLSDGHCGQLRLWSTFKLENQDTMSMKCHCPQEI